MPYKCTICNKTFRYKVSQRSHKCIVNTPGDLINPSTSSTTKDIQTTTNSNIVHVNSESTIASTSENVLNVNNCMNTLIFNTKGEIIAQNFCVTSPETSIKNLPEKDVINQGKGLTIILTILT